MINVNIKLILKNSKFYGLQNVKISIIYNIINCLCYSLYET